MSRKIILSLVFILALTFMISCSGGDGNIITPEPVNRDNVAVGSSGGTLCMGLWQVVIDAETGTGDIVQLRSADKILNVLGFMEPPALNMMDLDWPNLVIADPIVEVGVILTHPISNDPIFTGFDVRGVCFGPKVTNADGLTIITSPQYFKGVPFGYQDGLLGAPDSYAHYSGLAGYKYFCDGLTATEDLAEFFTDPANLDDRGSYGSGETNQRDYILDWSDVSHSFLVFNYCIYANYEWPSGSEPYTLDDFEISDANCAEAFACSVTELANDLWYNDTVVPPNGGSISLQVEVWDWLGDITTVTFESIEPGVIPQTGYDVALGAYPNGYSYGYEFYDVPGQPTATGDLDLLITVTDLKTFGECWFMDLLPTSNSRYNLKIYNCFIHTTSVMDYFPPTWDPPPVVVMDPGEGTKFRATDESEITNAHSSYDTATTFNVTGTNANYLLPIDYQYYISTSDTDQIDSPVGWVDFAFDNGGSFTVEWVEYTTVAPDILWAWVSVYDGITRTDPVLCPDDVALSEVLYDVSEFAGAGWVRNGWTGINWTVGTNLYMYRYYGGYGGFTSYFAYNTPIAFTGNNTYEWWSISLYCQYTYYSGLNPGHGPTNTLGSYLGTYTNTPDNALLTHNISGVTGNRYIGYRVRCYYPSFFNFNYRVDDVAIYANP